MNRYRVTRAFQSPPRDGDEADVLELDGTGAGAALTAAHKQLSEAAEAAADGAMPPWGWLPPGTYSIERLDSEAESDAELAGVKRAERAQSIQHASITQSTEG